MIGRKGNALTASHLLLLMGWSRLFSAHAFHQNSLVIYPRSPSSKYPSSYGLFPVITKPINNKELYWRSVRREKRPLAASFTAGPFHPSDDFEAQTKAAKVDDGSSSVACATFGIIKAMVGTGMLALPGGLAAVTDSSSGLGPAHLLLIALGLASGYTFSLYGRLTHATQATSLGDLWTKVREASGETFSAEENPSLIVSMASFTYCFGCCVAFSLVIGDFLSSLLRSSLIGLPALMLKRQVVILGATITAIFPLCNLSSLAALAPVSIVGVVGTVLTTLFMAMRCPAINYNSPYAVAGAGFLRSQPTFDTYNLVHSPAPLILMSMACVSLMAHFSAPDFYHSLKPKAATTLANEHQPAGPNVLRRFNRSTALGYLAVGILNSLTLAFGFLTFGGSSRGVILNNYCTRDPMANMSRLMIGVSVLGGYPLLMRACRSAALELFAGGRKVTRSLETRTTAVLLSIATAISLVAKDVGFVVSFNGALTGSSIIYTFPALLFLKLSSWRISYGEKTHRFIHLERWFCRFLVGLGITSAIVGGATSIATYFFPKLLT